MHRRPPCSSPPQMLLGEMYKQDPNEWMRMVDVNVKGEFSAHFAPPGRCFSQSWMIVTWRAGPMCPSRCSAFTLINGLGARVSMTDKPTHSTLYPPAPPWAVHRCSERHQRCAGPHGREARRHHHQRELHRRPQDLPQPRRLLRHKVCRPRHLRGARLVLSSVSTETISRTYRRPKISLSLSLSFTRLCPDPCCIILFLCARVLRHAGGYHAHTMNACASAHFACRFAATPNCRFSPATPALRTTEPPRGGVTEQRACLHHRARGSGD